MRLDDGRGVSLPAGRMLLLYIAGSYGFGLSQMVGFLLPLRASELGAPLEVIGLMVGAGGLLPALLSVPSGALTDRIGARRSFVLATIATGVLAVCFALTTSFWMLGLIQLVQGFFRSMGWVAAQTYVTFIGTPAQRPAIMGRFSFAANAGPFIAPLLVSAVAELAGFQQAFLFVALVAFGYTAVGLALPDVRPRAAPTGARSQSGAGFGAALALMRERGIQVALILTVVRLWLSSSWGPFYQVFLQDEGFRPFVIGTVLSANSAVALLVTLQAGRAVKLASAELVTAAALALGVLGMAVSPFVAVVPLVYLPALLLGTASGISLPLLMGIMGDNAPPGQRGVAVGLRGSATQAASMAGPVVAGQLVTGLGMALGFIANALILWSLLAAAIWRTAGRHRLGRRADHTLGV